MQSILLIIIGIALMTEGFLAVIYSSYVLLPPVEPPIMKPIEGLDYVLFMYKQTFLLSGIIGIFVTVAGVILRRKRK
ncbi:MULTISPECIES: hypothetical protein [Nitrosopumilus]|uniref:hypothetical protein n=1 Tax=Nitrosopumilus TaxID=338191 RepID=UPI001E3AA34F|nr:MULTISPECIES: hypothetical protein [Nitrosopumilus]